MEVLARIFSARKIPFVLIGENERYINFVNETVLKTQQATQGTVPEVGQWNGEDVYQIIAFVAEREKKLLDDLLDECAVTSWNDTGIDIIPRNGGKSAGIKEFMEQYGIERSEIMAFAAADLNFSSSRGDDEITVSFTGCL